MNVEQLKMDGRFLEAGQLAYYRGESRDSYGHHHDAESTREESVSDFEWGWDLAAEETIEERREWVRAYRPR